MAHIVLALQDLFWFQITWAIAMILAKCSYLFFYARVFPDERFYKALKVTGAICIIWLVVNLCGEIFECTPVAYLWDRKIPGGHCWNYYPYALTMSIANILLDLTIFILPLPLIWSMHLPRGQKLMLAGVFTVGSL